MYLDHAPTTATIIAVDESPQLLAAPSTTAGPNPAGTRTATLPRRDLTPELDVDAVMTGFIAWLARHELPPGRRRRYHLAAERFLCWHTGQRHWHTDQNHTAQHHDLEQCLPGYLATLRRAGHGLAELAVVEAGVGQLRHYLSDGVDQEPPPRRE
jgi:hypothetical protein